MNKKTKIALIIVVILVVAGILSLFVFKDKHNMSAYSEKMTIAIEKNDIQQVKEILRKDKKVKSIDLNKVQNNKMLKFEEMFDEVI